MAKTNGDAQAKEMIFEQIGINENEAHPLVMKAIDKTLSSSRVNIEWNGNEIIQETNE